MQTEYTFVLPRGYMDAAGQLHQEGKMRLATAADEILAINDPRVEQNEAYLSVILLSRVITDLGTLPQVTPQVLEEMFSSDFAFLEDLYRRLNASESVHLGVICPFCNGHFQIQTAPISETLEA